MLLPSCQWHSFFGSSPSGAGLLRSCTCTWCWIRSSLGSFLSKCPTKTLSYRQILFASSSSSFVYLLISKALPLQSATSPALDRHEYYLYVLVWQDTEEHIQAGDYYTSAASACAALGALACLLISTSANCLLMYHLDVQVLVEPS